MSEGKPTGIKRVILATGYSWAGMVAAFKSEAAFRQELALCIILVPLACWLEVSQLERALMIASLLLVLIVELINTAIESVIDRISTEQHPLSKKAKDLGSASVFIALLLVAVVWGEVALAHQWL